MNTYRTEGVVLKHLNFGEADRIVCLYTKHHGKVSCLAKGIRRMTSRKRGNLEIFNLVSFFAARGKGLDIITEVEAQETFSPWRKNLKKVAAAYEIAEIVDKLTAEGVEQEEVFDLLAFTLKELEKVEEKRLAFWVEKFGQELLRLLGFWPKDKVYPPNFNVTKQIEQIIERELKSQNFSRQV